MAANPADTRNQGVPTYTQAYEHTSELWSIAKDDMEWHLVKELIELVNLAATPSSPQIVYSLGKPTVHDTR